MRTPLVWTTVDATELKGGGRKSAGTECLVIRDFAEESVEELAGRIKVLFEEGFLVDVFVCAFRDRRKPDVSGSFPVPWYNGPRSRREQGRPDNA